MNQGASGGLPERDFLKALREVSKHSVSGSDTHAKFCYLLKPLVPGTEAGRLQGMKIHQIYSDIVKSSYGSKDGKALILFVLEFCDVSKDHTDNLKKFILTDFTKDDPDVKEFRFRQLLVRIATMLMDNSESAHSFVSSVAQGHLNEPVMNFEPVGLKSLLKLMQITCERELIGPEPDKIDALKEILEDAEREDIITKYVDSFNPHEKPAPIRVQAAGKLHTMGTSEEETANPDSHSELAL